jgi:hypothetical protein
MLCLRLFVEQMPDMSDRCTRSARYQFQRFPPRASFFVRTRDHELSFCSDEISRFLCKMMLEIDKNLTLAKTTQ